MPLSKPQVSGHLKQKFQPVQFIFFPSLEADHVELKYLHNQHTTSIICTEEGLKRAIHF